MSSDGEPQDEPSPSASEPDTPDTSESPAAARRRGRAASLPAARHRARVLALQALYEADASGHDPGVALDRLIADEPAREETERFARWLVSGVKQARAAVDERIRGAATQWPLEQLAVVDRNILRIAIYEMLVENETPVRVAVNEAVELAKAFGAEATPRFVNGVLGTLTARASE